MKGRPMIHKKYLLSSLALMFCFVLPLIAQTKPHQVLFALSSGDDVDWKLTLNNIRNLMSGLAPESVEVEVVAFGPGISFLKKESAEASEIAALELKHVRFVACETAMHKANLSLVDLDSGVETVPSGIVEVVRRQEQGWTYIKAGR